MFDMLDGLAAIQSYLEWRTGQAGVTQLSKGKFEALHVGRNSFRHRDRLETSQWEGRSAGHSGLLVDSSLIMRQQCILMEKKATFFMVRKNIAQK